MKQLGDPDSEIYSCIPIIAEGLNALPERSRKRLMFLLWNVNEISTGQLPVGVPAQRGMQHARR